MRSRRSDEGHSLSVITNRKRAKALEFGCLLGTCLLMMVGCSRPPSMVAVDSSWLPKAEELLAANQSVVTAVREGRLDQWEKDDRSLPGMIAATIQRRPGLVEAIRGSDATATPQIIVAEKVAYVALQHRTKFSYKSIDYAVLLRTENEWTLVATDSMRCQEFDDFADFGRPYEGDALDEIKKEIVSRRRRPDGVSLFVLDGLKASSEVDFELPETWNGEILDVRISHLVRVALPTDSDTPHLMAVTLFHDRSNGRNSVATEHYWQSYGNLVDNPCFFNPNTQPVVDSEGYAVSQKTAELIRSLFKTGDITDVCKQLAIASDNDAVLPYLDSARLNAQGPRDDNRRLIEDLAQTIDPQFQFDSDYGFEP